MTSLIKALTRTKFHFPLASGEDAKAAKQTAAVDTALLGGSLSDSSLQIDPLCAAGAVAWRGSVGLPLRAPSPGPQAKHSLRPPEPDSTGAPALRCIESASAMSVLISACLKADAKSFTHTWVSGLGNILEMLRSLRPPSEPKSLSSREHPQVLHRHSFPSLVL